MNRPHDTQQTDAFIRARPRLFAVAYRMLGSASDAEDILQDTFLRWQTTRSHEVQNAEAFLQKTTVNLCLDVMKSARHRRETYPGEWLPEPIFVEDPILSQDVSYAVLCTMERLTPAERAAFLLHDIFDADYAEISEILGRTETNCRRLTSRARRRIATGPKNAVPARKSETLAKAFLHASKTGDTSALAQILAKDAVLISDGGGKVAAAINPIFGREKIGRLCTGLAAKRGAVMPLNWQYCQLNGLPALLSHEIDGILQATLLEISEDQIHRIYVIRNPEKTAHLARRF